MSMLFAGQSAPRLIPEYNHPRSSWATSLKKLIGDRWDSIRKGVYRRACYRCEICSDQGPKWPVECHEVFEYNDAREEQTLSGIVALCPNCHKALHYVQSSKRGEGGEEIKQHIGFVNEQTAEEVENLLSQARERYKARNKIEWKVDLMLLTDYGFTEDEVHSLKRSNEHELEEHDWI